MKTILILIFTIVLMLAAGCSENHQHSKAAASADTTAAAEDYYTCPMHPWVRSDRPGACPVCGMALVKKTALKEASGAEAAALGRVSLSPTQRVLANISTVPVERRAMVKPITSTGVVDFAEPRRSLVTARFRGRIEQLLVDFPGMEVRKGQPLFELYSPDLVSAQQDFLLALRSPTEAIGHADMVVASRERLRTHFGMTDDQIDTIAREGQPRTTMAFTAPLSGTVLSKQVVEGQYVDEGTVLYEVADLSVVWIYLDVYEQDLRFVQRGQDVTIRAEAYPGEQFNGRVMFVDPVMNPETRTARIRTEASNPSRKLKPKMFVEASLSVQIPLTLVVPRSAVLSMGSSSVVWVETSPNAFEPRSVITGATGETEIQILSGLREGDSVAATGGYLIDSESRLQVPAAVKNPGHVHSTSQPGSMAEFSIHVKGNYRPDTLRVSMGVPVRLRFYREEESECTKEVVFKDFNIRRILAAGATTVIEIPATDRGSYQFSCGMDMVHGTLVVE